MPYCLHGSKETVRQQESQWVEGGGETGRILLGFDWVTITLQQQTSSDSVHLTNCNVLLCSGGRNTLCGASHALLSKLEKVHV